MIEKDHLEIALHLKPGEETTLLIYGTSDKAKLFEDDNAGLRGEAKYQLLEGCEYEYEFVSVKPGRSFQFVPLDEILRLSKRHLNAGVIRTGVYVGTLNLSIREVSSGTKYYNALSIEVQSVKADYRTDYRNMLADITQYYTELIMIQGSPIKQKFEIDANSSSNTLYQRFAFVQSIVGSEKFNNAIHKIISNPVKKWEETENYTNIANAKRLNKACLRQFVSSSNRMILPRNTEQSWRFSSSLSSVPKYLLVRAKRETVDIVENQFVKYVLITFYLFCQRLTQMKNAKNRLREEAFGVLCNIAHLLELPFFKDISSLSHLNLNSPVLQRKDGYRQILQAWLMFDLASKLSWNGGDNVFSAGKRNVAALYEYWVFFKLLSLVSEVFNISIKDKSSLVSTDNDRINLDLRQGKMNALRGRGLLEGRNLCICLYYNRTFSHHEDLSISGSWSTCMRPDYTLSIWPGLDSSEEGEKQAERDDLIVHIHFDAKYRLTEMPLDENFDERLFAKEKDENVLQLYRRGDLLKMHAYKDAIRRTSGAYVIYPGNAKAKYIKGFHEIIPGLGAFCLSPSTADSDLKIIKSFLFDIRDHLLNRASERERMAYYAHETYDEESEFSFRILKDILPESIDNKKLLPNETYVLIGYYHDQRHLDWIEKNHQYNFRAGYRNGSLNLETNIVSARYLLLHHGNGKMILYKINKKGPIVETRGNLIKRGYPQILKNDGTIDVEKENEMADNIYLMFSISKAEDELRNHTWDLSQINSNRWKSSHPFSVSLTDLMLVRNK